MDDLVAFLNARLDEDERVALFALCGYPEGCPEVMQPWKRSARWQAGDGRVTVEYVDGPPAMIAPKRPVLVHVARRHDTVTAQHIARHEPARVLADVAAKRQIIELVLGAYAGYSVLTRLALPFAEHPDYREDWKP